MITNFSPAQKPSFGATYPQIRDALNHIHRDPDLWQGAYKKGASALLELDAKHLLDKFTFRAPEHLTHGPNDSSAGSLASRLCNEGKAPLLTAKGLEKMGFKVEPYEPQKSIDSFLNIKISPPMTTEELKIEKERAISERQKKAQQALSKKLYGKKD